MLDEVAFYHSDTSANPGVEIYTAILPSLLTTKGLLVAISSAYKRHGLLYSKHKDFFATDNQEMLVVKGTTKDFNLTVDDAAIAAMRAADLQLPLVSGIASGGTTSGAFSMIA